MVIVKYGDEPYQETSCMNGTLQGAGEGYAMTIETHLTVPDEVVAEGFAAIEQHVRRVLDNSKSPLSDYVDFVVTIGASRDAMQKEE